MYTKVQGMIWDRGFLSTLWRFLSGSTVLGRVCTSKDVTVSTALKLERLWLRST